MQLVLSGNRIIAYGEDCFLSMGSTVVCSKTGKAYQNATVVNECGEIPCDLDKVGYEYHAGVFVPCAPYGMDNGEGYIMLACRDCATPKSSGRSLDDILGARLTIAAEFGSKVVCTNGERTVYPKEKNKGLWWIDLPAYGEWTVKATLGDVSGEQKINVDVLKEYFAYFGYAINVEYPEGAICTCSKGETVLTAPDTSGAATFIVYEPGTWTVDIVDRTVSASSEVEVEGVENEFINVRMNFTPEIKTTAESGITYAEGIEQFSWENLSKIAKAIACSGIDKTVSTVYVNDRNVYTQISIGDTKKFSLEGTTYTARILGFNHDDVTDSESYGATKAGISFETVEVYPTATVWGISESNWETSTVRESIAATYTKAETALKNVVVCVKKEYYYIDSMTGNTDYKFADDTFFALSYVELSGAALLDISEGEQYAYYAAGNSRGKSLVEGEYDVDDNGIVIGYKGGYHTRTCNGSITNYIRESGSYGHLSVRSEAHFSGAFCI